MEKIVLLGTKENTRDVEAEMQTQFVLSIVEQLGVPFDWNANEEFTVLDKIRLRKILGQYNVVIIDDMEGGMKIYLDRDQIANWKKPTYILKQDPSQIDRRNQLYIEMKCCYSSIFEESSS